MFHLSQVEHTLRVPPDVLNLPLAEAIKRVLETIFVDKVIPNVGLCVSVYDIVSIKGGFILPNEGAPTYLVVFRVILFCPAVGEVIEAKLQRSIDTGLQLSLGFFDDIMVPCKLLPKPSNHQPDPEMSGGVKWFWTYQNQQQYYIDSHDKIRFKVVDVKFREVPAEPATEKPFAPMVVIGSLAYDGLGPVSWWVDEAESEE
ncbi:RNA polymerase Rpb [Trema orientale]|uniref:DNA-directed RNA polymerase subunit n=1 Tax=Trema orientale TaxID=63057 RepID=A0A2P5DJ01_TREOI|nr:RNA polymerase Rpb [Trema orientale]